ncbi:phosphatidylethanolamine-binding protein [Purpureocillium lavendulum]|uniref:Phosphatidylethanolamine-binding protein n=1 Tax=Purpureocillium lavendulum TaxID=1247861 RepID=A0AB34G1N8_9HYPO|nr:phosphatidylethanolamine-binding protein [Purpureocillium lavendulum]
MSALSTAGLMGMWHFGLPTPAVVGAIILLLLGLAYRTVCLLGVPISAEDSGNTLKLWNGLSKGHHIKEQVREKDGSAVVIEPLHDFDWKTVEPRQFRHFKRIYHITMGKEGPRIQYLKDATLLTMAAGLQSDTPSDLIAIDKDYLDRVTHRRHLIEKHGSGVHGCLPGGVAAVNELYTYLTSEYLPTRFPTIFQLSDDGTQFINNAAGKTWPTAPPEDPAAALRVLGETVEEDMFLLHEMPEGHKSYAFVCCFPSGFDPSTKVGKLLKDIHAPVPSYDKIGASMERFFARTEVGKSVKRLNWAIQTHGELYNSGSNHMTNEEALDTPQDADINIDESYYRVELQTLTRLPRTRALLFSFKTYLYPLRQIKEEGLGSELADAVDGLKAGNAPGTWVYKGAARWSERVCEYLRA